MKRSLLTGFIAAVAAVTLLYFLQPVNILRPVFHKDIINRFAPEFKLDPLLVSAIIKVESNFIRHARSHRGAIGLMQLMPSTAKELALERGYKLENESALADPELNIELGMYYISKLRNEFNNDIILTLAAYNGGIGNVRSWQELKGDQPIKIEDMPFEETRKYIHKVTRTYKWLKTIQRLTNVFRRKPV